MPKGEKNRKLSDEDRCEIARRYLTPLPDGTWCGADTLAKEFGVRPLVIYYHLKKQGVETRNSREAFANGKRCKPITNLPKTPAPECSCGCHELTAWNQRKNRWNRYITGHRWPDAPYKDREWLHREYIEKGRSANDIAREFGIGGSAVRNHLRKHQIPIRDASAAHIGLQVGSLNPAWKGGVAEWEYSSDWKRLAREIRNRDEWTCQDCGERRKRWGHNLHVHHIDGNKLNNELSNLISLCATCHHQRHRLTA